MRDLRDGSLIAVVTMCVNDALVKGGAGALIGTLSSMFLLDRKRWPIIIGLGLGLGLSFANCQ